jgi:hypothetical protein
MDAFTLESEPLIAFARKQGLLVAGGWGIGADLLGWVYGLLPMVYAELDQPEFLSELLGLIAGWNQRRMQVVLDARVDLYIRRAWYENCDFWSPRLWKKFISPSLKAEADLAHQAGAKFGYIITQLYTVRRHRRGGGRHHQGRSAGTISCGQSKSWRARPVCGAGSAVT